MKLCGNKMNNSTAPPYELPHRNIYLSFNVTIFVFGMIGNILVMVIVSRKTKRSLHEMFILNLAVSDFSFILLVLPVSTYELFETLKKPWFFCRVVTLLQTITYFISIFTITSMAVHRCYVIVNPYKRKITVKTGYIWLGLIWFTSLIIVIPIAVVTKSTDGYCNEYWHHPIHAKIYTAVLFVLQFLLPLVIIAGAYTIIGIFLVMHKAPQTTVGSKTRDIRLEKKRKENKQIIITLAAIVVLFTICLLPGQIAWMVDYFGTPTQSKRIQIVYKFSSILDFIHACVNPVLYGLLTDKFRKDYKEVLKKILTCGKATITPDQDSSSINMHGEPSNNTRAKDLDMPSENESYDELKCRATAYDVTNTQLTYKF